MNWKYFLDNIDLYWPIAAFGLGGMAYQLYFKEKPTGVYNGRFGSTKGVLSLANRGIAVTTNKYLSRKQSFENFIAIGGTGSGKWVHVVGPSVENLSRIYNNASIIVNDPSGETYQKTAYLLKQRGYKILVVNFADPLISSKWNPLTFACTIPEINKITNILSRSTLKDSKDPFWNLKSNSLISCMIRIIKTQAAEYQNLYNVRNLIKLMTIEPERVDKLFLDFASPELLRDYKSFVALSPKMLSSITATSAATLQLFEDPTVASVTGSDSFDLEILRKEKVCLFIQTKIAEQAYYAPLVNTLITQLFSFTMSRLPHKGERPIYYIIDEAGSVFCPGLDTTLANIRKYRSGCVLLLQEASQLEKIYGAAGQKSILSNCLSKMYFKGQSLKSCKDLEAILGKYEFIDEAGKKYIRPVMASDEIRMIPRDKAIFLCDNHAPMYISLTPYYKSLWLRWFLGRDELEIDRKEVGELPPLLPI